jgi:transposase-like protein
MPCAGSRSSPEQAGAGTWTAEQKARIVAESCESGETVSAVARRHGLTPQQLFGGRRQARQYAEREAGKSGPAFTPVIVESCRAQPGQRATDANNRINDIILFDWACLRGRGA